MSLKTTIAAPFKHTRKEKMQKAEFIFYIAIEKKWMNRDQAELLLERARTTGLIQVSGGLLCPSFDIGEVSIPLGFKPTSAILEEDDPSTLLIKRVADATGRTPPQVAAEVTQLMQERFDSHIRIEAAVVLLAKQYHVPFSDLLDRLAAAMIDKQENR
jgi:hypothetical protein